LEKFSPLDFIFKSVSFKFDMLMLLFSVSFPFGEVIVDLGVEGVHEVDTALVVRSSGLLIGEVLSREMGIRAIKNLYATSLFGDIKLDAKRKGAGIKVIIKVEENPRLKSIDFKGNDKLKDGDISSVVDLSPPALLSDYKLFMIKEKILKLYEDKGISGTEISISQKEEEEGVKVTFDIIEGESYRVKKINFIGNDNLSDHTLSKVLSNKTKPWWMLWRNDELKVDSLESDAYKVEAIYRKNGYLNATVDSFFVNYKKGKAEVNYKINEGRLYYFGNTHLQGSEDLGFVSTKVNWESGEKYNEDKINDIMRGLSDYYTNRGYLNASIVPDYSVVDDSLIDVTLSVDRGSPVYIKHIKIKGNTKTYDKVIRRNITLYPGDLFQKNKLINSQRNIFRLGYFKNLGLNFEYPDPANPDSIDLIFKVEEKQTGQFSAGFGFAPSIGLTGNIGVTMPNVLGTGQSINFLYERTLTGIGNNSIQNLSLGYHEPWLFDTPTSVGFDIYKVYRRWRYYGQNKGGGAFSLGRILTPERSLTGYFVYRLEQTKLRILDEGVSYYIKSQEGTTWESSVSGRMIYDTRDSYIAASVGNYYSLQTKYAGGILGGDERYWELIFEARKFHSIFEDVVFMNRTRIGYAHSPIGRGVPLPERFFLGGVGPWGLRGYDDRTISPYSGIYPTGGNFAFLNNLELRLNFSKIGYAMIFLDAGNCFRDIQKASLSDLFYGIGIGFRMEVQMMGILGIDLGYGLNEERGREWKPHFQIGTTF